MHFNHCDPEWVERLSTRKLAFKLDLTDRQELLLALAFGNCELN